MLDSSGPRVVSLTPFESRNTAFDYADVTFNQPIDIATFTADDVHIKRADGSLAIATGISSLSAHTARIHFQAQNQRGNYEFHIGPDIADLDGRSMDQNQNGTNGESLTDVFTGRIVVIKADAIFTTATLIGETELAYDNLDIAVVGTTLTINGSHNFNSVHLIDGAYLTHAANSEHPTFALNLIVAEQTILESNTSIDVTGKGVNVGGWFAGGSYGGAGTQASVSSTYGEYADPNQVGVGARASGSGFSNVVSGGGLIRLTTGSLRLDGQIVAAGASDPFGPYGGSGGGIFISTDVLAGTGSISAPGGTDSASGGGGRVAIYYADASGFNLSAVTAAAGGGGAGAGTVYLKSKSDFYGTLIVSNGSGPTGLGISSQSNYTVPDSVVVRNAHIRPHHSGQSIEFLRSLTIENNASLTSVDAQVIARDAVFVGSGALLEVSPQGVFSAEGGLWLENATVSGSRLKAASMSLSDSSLITHPANGDTATYQLDVTVEGQLSIDATSRIDVTGKGVNVGGWFAGGSYGGAGEQASPSSIFGDYADPDEVGRGARAFGPGFSNIVSGGGLIRLTTGSLRLDGQIVAAGASDPFGPYGGSGGGIFISTDVLAGTGSISAPGGTDTVSGGGGRVAIYYRDTDRFDLERITAHSGGGSAGAGTVHIVHGHAYTHARSYAPQGINGGRVTGLSPVTVRFNKELSQTATSSIQVAGRLGRHLATSLALVGDREYQLGFPIEFSEDGVYQFSVHPTARDVNGIQLDQNANGIPGEPADLLEFTLILDRTPPRVTGNFPSGDQAGTISSIDIFLSEAIDLSTFSPQDISILRPDGQAITVLSLSEVGFNRFRVSFPPQTLVGQYQVSVGPDVRDLAGNQLDQDQDGVPGEPHEDRFAAAMNLVPVDLGLSELTLSASQLVAGQSLDLAWQGRNLTGAALLGSWIDAIYLSKNETWDPSDVLLTTVPHTGGLAAGQSYSGRARVNMPGVLPGDYHILVRADVANQERETNEANNLIASAQLPLAFQPLYANTPVTGTHAHDDRVDYYAIQLTGGETVKFRLDTPAGSRSEMIVSFAAVPTRSFFDQRSAHAGPHQELALTAINVGGTYYVMIVGDQVGSSPSYTLTADQAPFFVSSLSPKRIGNSQPGAVTLTGAGLDTVQRVDFVADDARAVSADLQIVSGTTVVLTKLPTLPGVYSVRVTRDGQSVTLSEALEVVPGGSATLITNLILPGAMSPGFPSRQTIWVEYRNAGTIAMPAPLLQVSVNSTGLLTADELLANATQFTRSKSTSLTNSVQVYGYGSTATAGLLQPGESGSIPIYYVGLEVDRMESELNFSLGSLTAEDTSEKVAYFKDPDERVVWERPRSDRREFNAKIAVEPKRAVRARPAGSGPGPVNFGTNTDSGGGFGNILMFPPNVFEEYLVIDWNALRLQSRPTSIPTDAWDTILYNLRDSLLAGPLGSDLWADYIARKSQIANYLSSIGQTKPSADGLFGFEVAQAAASLHPLRYLAGAVDVSVPAPGISLSFQRIYGQDLPSRFRTGPLARGWSHNWDIYAVENDAEDVTLYGTQGAERYFAKNKNGTYLATPGDYGQLARRADRFTLTETDQTVWEFRTDGLLSHVQDANGNRITLAYENGMLTSLTHSSGQQILFAYADSSGPRVLTQVTETLGPGSADDRVTRYEYDASRQHLLRVIAPGDRITRYTYEPVRMLPFQVLDSKANLHTLTNVADPRSHALLSVQHADGTHNYFVYDSRGRLIETRQDSDLERVQFQSVSEGGVRVVDSTGRALLLNFGLGGQLAQVRDGDNRTVQLAYDPAWQFNSLGGPGGEQYRYTHNAKGNLIKIRDALNLETSFTYETNFQRLSSFTDARGNGIKYSYDTRGNLTRITYEDGTHEAFAYDSMGNMTSATNRRGQTIAYAYNAAGQVTQKDYLTTPALVDFMYQYDTAGNLTEARDASGATRMTYDPATDRLTRIEYPDNKFFTFTYDSVGRRTRRSDQDGHIEYYSYDSIGRLDRMTDGSNNLIVDYNYDSAGRLSKKTLGNGVYTTYAYDAVGNVLSLVNLRPDHSILSQFDYTYDVSGRRTSMTTTSGRFDYGYDALGQLTSVKHPDGRRIIYLYDEVGNRRQVIDDDVTTDYLSNHLNQYTQVGNISYVFDADGNLISLTENGATTTFTYDVENRLTQITTPTRTWKYTYDGFGNRIGSEVDGQTTQFVIDPIGFGNVSAEYDGSGIAIARYSHGYGLLSRSDLNGPAFYTFQAVGHTSEITGPHGTVLNSYAYDPFGISVGKNELINNPFQYVGEYGVVHEANGLEFMRARVYLAKEGRFTQDDPLGISGGMNLYTYAANTPAGLVDPTGLKPKRSSYFDPTNPLNHVIPGSIFLIDFGPIGSTGCGSTYSGIFVPDRILNWNLRPFCDEHDKNSGDAKSPREKDEAHKKFGDAIREHYPDWLGHIYQYFVEKYDKFEPPSLPPSFPPGDPSPQPPPVPISRSRDPNDKLAPSGFGSGNFIRSNESLTYTIRFENESDAMAPAREILITDRLDSNLDLDTFELLSIHFADQHIAVPAGLSQYETSVVMAAGTSSVQVNVTASLDREGGQFTLLLRAVDPQTGWSPEDPLVGLLYPNDLTRRGEGSVSFRVKALAGLPSGTEITNRARIYFDTNDPIDTPLVLNTLDAGLPTSRITTPSATIPGSTTSSTTIALDWSGQDDAGGVGITSYQVYASIDGSPYFTLIFSTTMTSAQYEVQPGHTYSFYTIAMDAVGHVELAPTSPDTTISIPPVFPWSNPVNALDVSGDNFVTAIDALLIINRLNTLGPGPLNSTTATIAPPFFDSSRDGFLSALDALLVINFLNTRGSAEGEFTDVPLRLEDMDLVYFSKFSLWASLPGLKERQLPGVQFPVLDARVLPLGLVHTVVYKPWLRQELRATQVIAETFSRELRMCEPATEEDMLNLLVIDQLTSKPD